MNATTACDVCVSAKWSASVLEAKWQTAGGSGIGPLEGWGRGGRSEEGSRADGIEDAAQRETKTVQVV